MAEVSLNSMPSQIDHIVILVSPEEFENVPSWLTDNFNIIEGGTHSKGTSHNKLIIFQDGTYLELFSWVDPPPADVPAHADFPGWADKPLGAIIDWAVTGADAHGKFHDVTSQLKESLSDGENLNVSYDQPIAGGRKRKDGQELRWVTTRPRRLNTADVNSDTDLGVPFFCHDISARELRVPYVEGSIESWPSLVSHPSGVIGIAGLKIAVPIDRIEAFKKLYEAILGVEAEAVPEHGEGTGQKTYKFLLSTPAYIREQGSTFQADGLINKRNGPEAAQISSFVELQGVEEQPTGTSLQELMLRTNGADRNPSRIDNGKLKTPILLT